MDKLIYHSALSEPACDKSLDRFKSGGSVAIAHDVFAGHLPEDFNACDVIYAEPAWRAGFEKFNKRAGVEDQRTYSEYLKVISTIVTALNKPSIVISGRHAKNGFSDYDAVVPVQLVIPADPNGGDALAFLWNFPLDIEGMKTPAIIQLLAEHYGCVGDFCCGYGHTGKVFKENNKNFVLSDYNAKCIGYISEHEKEWGNGD